MTGRSGGPRTLVTPASPDAWGDSLDRYMRMGRKVSTAPAVNEVRWGDTQSRVLAIGAGIGTEVREELRQVIDVRWNARVWRVWLALQWQNPPAVAFPLDVLNADFIVLSGVGSGKVSTFRNLNLAANNPITTVDVAIELPAATIIVEARLRCTPTAGVAREYRGLVTAMAAPVMR